MTSICELSDDLLVKILSLVKTEEAVATSLLSKRWLSLWKLVPRLDYGSPLNTSRFINNFLLLSKAPVLETFHLRLGMNCKPEEHERWVDFAVARHVRNLELIHLRYVLEPMPCPRSLFTCKGLVVLRLQDVGIWDIPSTIFLQSLKDLSLLCVKFFYGDELVHRLLSACPILETLIVRRRITDSVMTFRIAVPSLQSLYIIDIPYGYARTDGYEYVLNAPCLKTLKVSDEVSWFRSLVKMLKLVKAEIKSRQEESTKLLGCIASAKHLSLCVTSARQLIVGKYGENLCQLEYLELCTNCSSDWLCPLLRHSPKLRVLRLNNQKCWGKSREIRAKWEQPCCVPECLVSSLETVEWVGYRGIEAEKEAAIYILEKANHLKKMTLFRKIANLREKYRALIDLASRLSCCSKCRLEFVPLK